MFTSCNENHDSTIEDDQPSPELGHPTTPPRAPQFSTEPSETIDKDQDEEEVEDEEEEEEEPGPKKKRTLNRDTREWTLLLRLDKGDQAGFDDEEINHLVYLEAKKIMEQSGLCKLASFKPKHTYLRLWKRKVGWGSDRDYNIYQYLYVSSRDKVLNLWMFLPAQDSKLTSGNDFRNAGNP